MGAVAGFGAIEAYRHLLAGPVERWRGRVQLEVEQKPDVEVPTSEAADRAEPDSPRHGAVEGSPG